MPVARDRFPALREAPDLCYLDSSATTLLPQCALDALVFELSVGGSAGRSGHVLGSRASGALEKARARIGTLMGVPADELVVVPSATDGLMLAAEGLVGPSLRPGDRIIVCRDAHHANLLPWRRLAERMGIELAVVGVTERGELDRRALLAALGPRTRAVALTHVSNVTGAVLPLSRVVEQVRTIAPTACIVVDGTQAVAHLAVRPSTLGVDAYVWSAHKAYGALGAGFVWAPSTRWAEGVPVRWGGGMVTEVSDDVVYVRDAPWGYEAGTLNHPAVVCAAEGLRFLCAHRDPAASRALATQAAEALAGLPGVHVVGAPYERTGLVSFWVEGIHPHDLAQLADDDGIALRAGHHCAQPLLEALGLPAAVRASFGLHSVAEDIDRLVVSVARAQRLLGTS